MKLLDIILEDENKEKLIKKAKTIYKGVKTGLLRKGVFGKVVYVLPDEYDIQIDVHDDIFIKLGNNRTKKGVKFYYVNDDDGEMKPLRVNPTEYQLNLRLIEKKKFKPFDIIVWWEESYPTNEPEIEEINESTDDDQSFKKAFTVNKALRKGTITLHTDNEDREVVSKYRYELPMDCQPYTYEEGYMYEGGTSIKYIYGGNRRDKIGNRFPLKIWKITDDGEVLLNDKLTNHDFDYIEDGLENTELSHIFVKVMNHIRKKYESFDIDLDLSLYYPKQKPLNENEEREIKKVKAVFKAFKFTLYRKVEDYNYYFQLPDHVKIVTDEPGVKEFRSLRRYGDDIICVQVGHDGENSSVKSFKKKDGEDKLIKLDLNAGKYMHLTAYVNEKLKPFNIKVVYKGRNGKWD